MIADRVRRTGASKFRSLHTRNYRLYFTGQLVSIALTWTQTIAQALLVLAGRRALPRVAMTWRALLRMWITTAG